MKNYYEKLKELTELEERINNLLDENIVIGGGKISFSKRKNGYQYYIYHPTGPRTYVRKADLGIIQKMAQQEYLSELQEAVKRQKKTLEHFLKNYNIQELDEIYEKKCNAKKIIISPLIQPVQEYVEQWLCDHPGQQNPFPEKGKYVTERGEYVRSKSEKILADLFNKHGIPYQYEPGLKLKNGRRIYPDFVLLNVEARKTIYWEHLGLVADEDYASKNLEKINDYEKNGFEINKDIIVTMETEFSALDIKLIERKIAEYFKNDKSYSICGKINS